MRIISTTVALILAGTSLALAQTGNAPGEIKQPGPPRMTAPGVTGGPVVKPGGVDNGGPGSIGTIAPGATGASSISNNSGAAGNAEQNQKPIGNTGGGGGS